MQVLTHEIGHAFAAYMAMREQPVSDYYSESTDIAEIHSMSMEQFAYPYAERFFGGQADKFRFAHLQEAITFVPFGMAVEFKKKGKENHEKAWADYLKLCKCGGSVSYLETLQYAGVSNPFEVGSVERAVSVARDELLGRKFMK